MDEQEKIDEKLDAFLGAHQRILAEFGRSLANSRHFLKLAGLSQNREPEETLAMLEQIREIDLLGHLTSQFEEYNSVAGAFLPPNAAVDPVDNEEMLGQLAELHMKYEALLEEAEGQMETIEELLNTTRVYH